MPPTAWRRPLRPSTSTNRPSVRGGAKSASRRCPASTSRSASAGVPSDPVDGGGHHARSFGSRAGSRRRPASRAPPRRRRPRWAVRPASPRATGCRTLVLRQADEHVGVRVPGGELARREVLAVADGIGQAELVGAARRPRRRRQAVTAGRPGGAGRPGRTIAGRATGPRPDDAGPCWERSARRRGARSTSPWSAASRAVSLPVDPGSGVRAGRPGSAPPRWPDSPAAGARAALNAESAIPRAARGRQLGHLAPGQRHLLAGVVLPALVEGRRGDVVVVEDQGLGPAQQELGHRRRGAQLVEQDVPGLGPLRIPLEVGRLVLQFVVGRLDVDVRLPTGRPQGVAQRQRVIAGGVPGQQRGNELVDGGHRSRTATSEVLAGPSSRCVDRVDGRVDGGGVRVGRCHPVELRVVAAEGDRGRPNPSWAEQVGPGLGMERPSGGEVADQMGRCRPSTTPAWPSGAPARRRRPAGRRPGRPAGPARWGGATGPIRSAPCRRAPRRPRPRGGRAPTRPARRGRVRPPAR